MKESLVVPQGSWLIGKNSFLGFHKQSYRFFVEVDEEEAKAEQKYHLEASSNTNNIDYYLHFKSTA